jgi:hypothetical protein
MRTAISPKLASLALFMAFLLVIGSTGCSDKDALPGGPGGGPIVPPLGAAAGCAILGATPVVSNTGPTMVTGGDICISPALSFTGWLHFDGGPGTLAVPGLFRAPSGTGANGFCAGQCGPDPDPIPAQAQLDWITAYNNLVARPSIPIVADLSGLTLTPGTYKASSSLGILSVAPGPLSIVTLDGLGDPNAVFVFQIGSALTTATGTQVKLTNGTQAKNVFWACGSAATLGVDSIFNGNILASTDITVATGATVNGRLQAHTGQVNLDSNIITVAP